MLQIIKALPQDIVANRKKKSGSRKKIIMKCPETKSTHTHKETQGKNLQQETSEEPKKFSIQFDRN